MPPRSVLQIDAQARRFAAAGGYSQHAPGARHALAAIALAAALLPVANRPALAGHTGSRSDAKAVLTHSLTVVARTGSPLPPPAPPPPTPDSRQVYLVLMYPGDALFTGYGHIAIRIVDPANLSDEVYDYGTYDAADPWLPFKFLVGSLSYYCSHSTYRDTVDWFSRDFGGVMLKRLALTPDQIDRLAAQVAFDCLPENAAYQYHHFTNNCSTKLRDFFDDLLGSALSRQTRGQPAGRSIRDLINASMGRWQFAFTRWFVYGLLNYEIDGPADRWQQMFLPHYLAQELDQVRQPMLPDSPPLVLSSEIVVGVQKGESQPPADWPGAAFLALLAWVCHLPISFARRARPRAARLSLGTLLIAAGLAAGTYGTILAVGWAVSPYPETRNNFTMLCFHPLHFFLVAGGIGVLRSSSRLAAWTRSYLRAGLILSPLLVLLNLAGLIPQYLWPYALATAVTSAVLLLSLRRVRTA